MDMISALRSLLGPLLVHTPFAPTKVRSSEAMRGRRFGLLEYHGQLDDGRTVRLGLYQFSAWRTITAEMWIPNDVRRMPPEASIESVAMHRQVWPYDLLTDGDVLARTIATEVATWLHSFGSTAEPGLEGPSSAS
jgi:hypothetical protein